MSIAVYPGTFDPLTNGHFDLIFRASTLADELVIGVASNPDKKPLFSAEERIDMIMESMQHVDNVEAFSTEGLVADFARDYKAVAIIRGLRHVSDFEFEFQMATMNHHLNSEVSTLLMVTSEKFIHLNSSVVKDVARLKGDISNFVTPVVMQKLKDKFDLI